MVTFSCFSLSHSLTLSLSLSRTHTLVFGPVSASAHIMINTKAGQVLSIPQLQVELDVQQVDISLSKMQVSTCSLTHHLSTPFPAPTHCHTIRASQAWENFRHVCVANEAQTNGPLVSTSHCDNGPPGCVY